MVIDHKCFSYVRYETMSALLPCEEKVRLLIEYQITTAAYSTAVSNLVIMGLSADEYAVYSADAEETRLAAQDARDKLERHIKEHGC